jgi:golgin subfamily B member 1
MSRFSGKNLTLPSPKAKFEPLKVTTYPAIHTKETNPTSIRVEVADKIIAYTGQEPLFEQQGMWSELADNVGRQLELSDDPDRQIALMLKLAELRETRMHATDAAIEIHREVLERESSNERALAALERLIAAPEYQMQIAEILEPLYRDSSDFQKLIGIYEIQIRNSASADQRVLLLHRMAELQEIALDDLQAAFASFARALEQDPANVDTQEQIERIARTGNAWAALAEVYEREIGRVEDPLLTAAIHVKAAEIREQHLGDHEGAIAHYVRVLELDQTRVDAATALERLYQLGERYEDLARTYLAKAAMLDVPEERKEYYFRGAAIYEEILERPQDAIAVYAQVLEVEPDDLAAIDKLVELYLRLEQWENLLLIYTRKADVVVDPDEKKALFAEVGAVYERELAQVDKAIDIYQRILEIDPDDLAAINRLDALYQATENWQELLAMLEREADLVSDPSEAISYRYRIGELWEHKLGDAARAVDCYREILDVAPDHEPTLRSLERMVAAIEYRLDRIEDSLAALERDRDDQ